MSKLLLKVRYMTLACCAWGCTERDLPVVASGGAGGRSEPRDAGEDAAPEPETACESPSGDGARASAPRVPLGPPLRIGRLAGERVSVWSEDSGIDGIALLNQSSFDFNGPITTPAVLSAPPGKLCLAGSTVIVPAMNFAEYWGAAIELLLLTSTEDVADAGAPSADASASDAGRAPPQGLFFYYDWDLAGGDVVGFSFVIEGSGSELTCGGVPPLLRVQNLPGGADRAEDIYCRDFRGIASGERLYVPFSEVTRDCWDPGGRALFADPLPAGQTRTLAGISWVVPADEVASYSFDLCISDIRPMLAN